ncbi:MAG: sialate O-acetylesterase, partial [Mucilaginibacter sp.]
MRSLLATFFLAFVFLQADAQLTTAKLFNDHAVLQRNQPVPVWGWGKKNSRVTLSFNGQVVSTKAEASGRWEVTLKPMNAGGPYAMKISSGKDQLVYNDMMLGEVWICSGQSNMEFHLRDAYGYNAEQKAAATLPIRQFTVPDKLSLQPENELTGGQWTKADTNTVGNFTAVGYFFAKKLAQNLHVAVGLIYTNWGGTQVEDWISKEAMLASPEMSAVAQGMPQNDAELKQRADRQLKAYAYHNQQVVNYTAQELAAQPGAFFNDWQKGNAPGAWEWMGKLYSYRGEGFMQKTIKLDSSYATRPSVIRFGLTDAEMAVYINGKLINSGRLPASYQLDLPAGTWKSGDNSLLVNFLPQQKYGLGLNSAGNDLYIKFADTLVNLADGNWHTMPDLSKPYHFDFLPNNTAFALYNSMINPLIPYAMAGVIWYQGESNVDRAFQYRATFPMMIADWRNRWKRQFPFLFVQISSFGTTQNSNVGSSWAELREAQTLTLQLPNTGMAVTTDIGDAFNIHPRDKADVGFRLADKALSMTYHLPGFS